MIRPSIASLAILCLAAPFAAAEDAAVFAPGAVCSGLSERDLSFTPDGREALFTLWTGSRGVLMRSRLDGAGRWSEPERLAFSGVHSDLEPFVASGGRELFFSSDRPREDRPEATDYDVWVSARELGGEWGDPRPVEGGANTAGDEFYPTLSRAGELCLTSAREGGQGGEDLWLFERLPDGSFGEGRNPGPPLNGPRGEFNGLLTPDGRALVYSTWGFDGALGGGDLVLSRRGGDGQWSAPSGLPAPANSPQLDYCPALSPDGATFYFSSRRTLEPDWPVPPPTTLSGWKPWLDRPGNGQGDVFFLPAAAVGLGPSEN